MAGDVAVAEDRPDAGEKRHLLAVDLRHLPRKITRQCLRHSQSDGFHGCLSLKAAVRQCRLGRPSRRSDLALDIVAPSVPEFAGKVTGLRFRTAVGRGYTSSTLIRFDANQSRACAGMALSLMTCFTAVSGEMSTGPALPNLLESQTRVISRAARDQRPLGLGDFEAAFRQAFLEVDAIGREEQPVGEELRRAARSVCWPAVESVRGLSRPPQTTTVTPGLAPASSAILRAQVTTVMSAFSGRCRAISIVVEPESRRIVSPGRIERGRGRADPPLGLGMLRRAEVEGRCPGSPSGVENGAAIGALHEPSRRQRIDVLTDRHRRHAKAARELRIADEAGFAGPALDDEFAAALMSTVLATVTPCIRPMDRAIDFSIRKYLAFEVESKRRTSSGESGGVAMAKTDRASRDARHQGRRDRLYARLHRERAATGRWSSTPA